MHRTPGQACGGATKAIEILYPDDHFTMYLL